MRSACRLENESTWIQTAFEWALEREVYAESDHQHSPNIPFFFQTVGYNLDARNYFVGLGRR